MDYQALLDAPISRVKPEAVFPASMEELDAIITDRILAFYRKLEMDGRLLPDEREHRGPEVTP